MAKESLVISRQSSVLKGLLAVSVIFCAVASWAGAPEDPFKTWGEPAGGLQVGILSLPASENEKSNPQFFIAFKNAGPKDLMLNLGTMEANESKYYLTRVGLVVSDSQGRDQALEYQVPKGFKKKFRKDYLVPLPAGSKYMIRVGLNQFGVPGNSLKLAPGKYKLMVDYRPISGLGGQPAPVQSKTIELKID